MRNTDKKKEIRSISTCALSFKDHQVKQGLSSLMCMCMCDSVNILSLYIWRIQSVCVSLFFVCVCVREVELRFNET